MDEEVYEGEGVGTWFGVSRLVLVVDFESWGCRRCRGPRPSSKDTSITFILEIKKKFTSTIVMSSS